MVHIAHPTVEAEDTKFAFVHRSIVNADDLFRRLSSEADYHASLDVTWYSTDFVRHRFRGPNLLGESEALVLLALLAKAGVGHRREESRAAHVKARAEQRNPLDWLNGPASTTVEVTTSLRQLAGAVGLGTGGASLQSVRSSLVRLSTVKVWVSSDVDNGHDVDGGHFLITSGPVERGEFRVRLAPMLVDALLGNRGEHTMVVLSDIVRQPASGYGRLLAFRLCWINQGEFRPLRLGSLASYIWYGREPTAVERTRLRAALNDLQQGGWTVQRKEKSADEIYIIGRSVLAAPAPVLRRRRVSQAAVQDA